MIKKPTIPFQKISLYVAVSILGLTTFSASALNTDGDKSAPIHLASTTSVLDYADVFELEYAASPTFHPSKEMLVYERRSMDIMTDRSKIQLWTYDLKTQQHLPLLADGNSYSAPRFSADGERLAYLSAQDGKSQIYVRWMETNRTAKLSSLHSSPSNITWSPDGQSIAFTMFTPTQATSIFKNMPKMPKDAKWADTAKYIDTTQYRSDGAGFNSPGFQQVYVISAEGGTPHQVTVDEFNHGGQLSWSTDSKALYFSANRDENWALLPYESNIYRVNIATGEIESVTEEAGPESAPLISPNGKYITYKWVNDRKLSYQVNQIMLQALDSEKPTTSLTSALVQCNGRKIVKDFILVTLMKAKLS
jgi:Tol biopolymer transport system component